MILFQDRIDAAMQLLPRLKKYKGSKGVVLLAVPRGGLELGAFLAKELHLPLDIILSKKIGYPNNPEFAIGAVSLQDWVVKDQFLKTGEVSKEYIDREVNKIQMLLQEKDRKYHEVVSRHTLIGKTVIVVDDGVATGQTLLLTLSLLKNQGVKKIIVAIPVGPPHAIDALRQHADEVICLECPENFYAIGQFYARFDQVEEENAIRLLKEANT